MAGPAVQAPKAQTGSGNATALSAPTAVAKPKATPIGPVPVRRAMVRASKLYLSLCQAVNDLAEPMQFTSVSFNVLHDATRDVMTPPPVVTYAIRNGANEDEVTHRDAKQALAMWMTRCLNQDKAAVGAAVSKYFPAK